jgi:hypothetical protein
MKSFDHYKRVVLRSAERGLIDYEAGKESKSSIVSKMIAVDSTKAERITSAFKLVKEFLPKNKTVERVLQQFSLDTNSLPFDMNKLEFKGKVGQGSVCDVYLLESKDEDVPSYVIKIQSHSIEGSNSEKAFQTAKESEGDYKIISGMYKDVPGLIPQEFTLVIENPRHHAYQKEPSVAIIQRFYGRDIRDLFKEISFEDVLSICKSDPEFLATMRSFVDITLKNYNEKGILRDGKNNLVMLDPHIIYSKDDKEMWGKLKADKAVEYLKSLQASLSSIA